MNSDRHYHHVYSAGHHVDYVRVNRELTTTRGIVKNAYLTSSLDSITMVMSPMPPEDEEEII